MPVGVVTYAHGSLPTVDGSHVALVVGILVIASAYMLAARRAPKPVIGKARAASFLAGLAALAAALSSPVEHLAVEKLSAHMAQHLMLWLVAPPLIVWGRPVRVAMLALSLDARRRVQRLDVSMRPGLRVVTSPAAIWMLSTGALWAWHLPRLYESAIRDEVIHTFEHAAFLGVSLLFWSYVSGSAPHRRVRRGAAILLVFATMVQSSWLAMVLSFSDRFVYAAYGDLADQHLAGVVMWLPMTLVYAIVAGLLFVRWFGELENRTRSREGRDALAMAPLPIDVQ